MNYAVDRRRPVARAHLATDRLRLPWIGLEDSHSRFAIIVGWLAMAVVLLFAAAPDFADGPHGSAATIGTLNLLPLVALALPFNLILPESLALTVAAAVLPLLQLLVALILVRGTLRCLGFHGAAANIGLVIVPLLPLAVAVFAPLRVGEQAWEALFALVILRLAVDRRKPVRKALLAGLAGGFLLTLSPIGMLLAASVAAFFSLLYLREGDLSGLAGFAFGTALSATMLFLVSLSVPQWAPFDPPWLDWPSLFGFWSAACVAGALSLLRRPPPGLLRLLSVIAVLLAMLTIPATHFAETIFPAFAAGVPVVQAGPAGMARSVDGAWHDATGMLLATVALWLVAIAARRETLARSANPRGWLAVVVLSGAMMMLAFVTSSAALLAQLLAVPLFALLLRDALRVASRLGNAPMRVAGIALALFALTPTGGAMATGFAVTVAHGDSPHWPEPFSHAVAGLAAIDLPG